MPRRILIYISGDFSRLHVQALRVLVGLLAERRRWTWEPPHFVELVRTVGIALTDIPVSARAEIFEAIAKFSRQYGVDFGVQFETEHVGGIRDGSIDDLVRIGLLQRW